jgi:acyl carrier protein
MRFWMALAVAIGGFAGCGPSEQKREKGEARPTHSSVVDKGVIVRLEDVRQIVARQFNLNVEQLDVNRPLVEYGDELDVVEVVMTLEDRYRVKIPDERIMDKAARGSAGIHKDLNTAKLARIVQAELSK